MRLAGGRAGLAVHQAALQVQAGWSIGVNMWDRKRCRKDKKAYQLQLEQVGIFLGQGIKEVTSQEVEYNFGGRDARSDRK